MLPLNWWVRPHLILLALVLPLFIMCSSLTAADLAQYGVYNFYLTPWNIFIGFLSLAAFIVSILLGSRMAEEGAKSAHENLSIIPEEYYAKISVRVGMIVLFAYLVFFLPLATHPGLVIDLFRGSQTAMFELRETLNAIPGLTSFTNLQSLYVVLYLLFGIIYRKPAPRLMNNIFYIMLACCVLRMFAWSERIAIMEFAIPFIILRFGPQPKSETMRKFMAMAPVYGVFGVIGLFAVGEYFRSWQYYNDGTQSFFAFIIARLSGYYTTAINNVLGFYTYNGPLYEPILTGNWVYKLPFSKAIGLTGDPQMADFLEYQLNPEFNNPSGLYSPLMDFGLTISLVIWVVLGLGIGRMFKSFVQGHLFGLLFYPSAFIGLVELLRIFYWGNSRYFPTIVVTLIVWQCLRRHLEKPAPLPLPESPRQGVRVSKPS